MATIYFLPGIGGDERLFSAIKKHFPNARVLHWEPLQGKETIQSYAAKLSLQIDSTQPIILVGVSLGGILAIEICKILKPAKLILISSAKTYLEIPYYYRVFKYLPVYKILSNRIIQIFGFVMKPFFDDRTYEYRVFKDALVNMDSDFIKWVCKEILHWKNTTVPANILHLHGTQDRILPYKYIKNFVAIKGGTHYMIVKKADEISRHIKAFLEE